MRFSLMVAAVVAVAGVARAGDVNLDRRLVVACHRLDVEGVVAALRDGADVNARFGDGDAKVFQNPWTLGRPMAAKAWTPLIALANSSSYPDPPRKVRNTSEDRDWAREQLKKVPAELMERRARDTLTIALILLSHKAYIDADDGYGATALYAAVYGEKLEFAKLLLRFGAEVNTKTGIYVDGSGDITPLHRAYWSAELTKLLLEKGADPTARDTKGKTPLDWARRSGDPAAVAKLYPAP